METINWTDFGNLRVLIAVRLARCEEECRRKAAARETAGATRYSVSANGSGDSLESIRKCLIGKQLPDNRPHPPNLRAKDPSFSARIMLAVNDRFAGNAPAVYNAAKSSRQTYSQIISDETHKVDKTTAIRFAFALQLSLQEAHTLLKSAGFAFSSSDRRDCILQACLEADPPVWNLDTVNLLLKEYDVDFQF